MSRTLDLISPRIKMVSAGMISRDRKERVLLSQENDPNQVSSPSAALTKKELEDLQRVFNSLTSTSNIPGKFGKEQLEKAFQTLGYSPQRVTDFGLSECEDMIWEVDDDCDGYIDWPNFVSLYSRARSDRCSKEPRRLFNLIDFMLCDKDGGGNIDEDECLDILYRRYGRDVMDKLSDKLTKMFGRELDYTEFLQLVGDNLNGGGRIKPLLESVNWKPAQQYKPVHTRRRQSFCTPRRPRGAGDGGAGAGAGGAAGGGPGSGEKMAPASPRPGAAAKIL